MPGTDLSIFHRWLRHRVGAFSLFLCAPTAVTSREQQVGSSTLPTLTLSLPPPRWLSYLLLFILDLVICLVTCLGLARRSKCLLAS